MHLTELTVLLKWNQTDSPPITQKRTSCVFIVSLVYFKLNRTSSFWTPATTVLCGSAKEHHMKRNRTAWAMHMWVSIHSVVSYAHVSIGSWLNKHVFDAILAAQCCRSSWWIFISSARPLLPYSNRLLPPSSKHAPPTYKQCLHDVYSKWLSAASSPQEQCSDCWGYWGSDPSSLRSSSDPHFSVWSASDFQTPQSIKFEAAWSITSFGTIRK